jgi:hypothetical protein
MAVRHKAEEVIVKKAGGIKTTGDVSTASSSVGGVAAVVTAAGAVMIRHPSAPQLSDRHS